MTETVVSSATREVVIGFDRPFVIIGERINPTGRKLLATEMAAGDFSRVEADALAQVAAGAHMLDVNAGIPLADEPAILAKAVRLVQSITDVPLSIDSSIVAALEAGLSVYQGKALVNSVTGERERLDAILPLVARYGAAVIALPNEEDEIPEEPEKRLEITRKIVEIATGEYGIPPDNPYAGGQMVTYYTVSNPAGEAIDPLDEVFAYGFRSPYRMNFDRLTGGESVTFDIEASPKGPRAVKVQAA